MPVAMVMTEELLPTDHICPTRFIVDPSSVSVAPMPDCIVSRALFCSCTSALMLIVTLLRVVNLL
eukprot:CAMPEP_0179439688 /NCGR_PEP_ID=MMETSP0799-20121207/23317_1 /TAXON_ID=46947 /ORGANISM="Geminigera cryophila, Strain CCMP2564" /LENGTH=64 /DNA_ID=CAMNT_0021222347 /DNA_START=962 /DNA_END=1156 /DNA_ORIENTATION=+